MVLTQLVVARDKHCRYKQTNLCGGCIIKLNHKSAQMHLVIVSFCRFVPTVRMSNLGTVCLFFFQPKITTKTKTPVSFNRSKNPR